MDLPSVVNSTWDSGAILSKSRMGRSITTAQLFPCFTKFLIIACPPLESNAMVDQCTYTIAFKLPEVKELLSFSTDGSDDRRPPCSLRFHGNGLSNASKRLGKHPKVRFLSCPQDRSTLYFQLSWLRRFSHIWPIALAFLHVHARACLHMLPK